MSRKRKIAVAAALASLGGIALGTAPASADQPSFGCYANADPSQVYVLTSQPGDDTWAFELRQCHLKQYGTVRPYQGP